MFDVDKLYTYNYSTVETVENPEELKELRDELKLFFSEEAKAGRNQYKELSDYVNDNWLDQDVYSEIMSRLNLIKSEHSRIKDLKNKIKSIKTKIVLNDKDSLVNDILDIHMSVLSNPNKELSRLILTPNGFGKFKTSSTEGLAFEIDAIKQAASGASAMTNYLSPQYQMMKFFNGVSGKAGVGVFSSLSGLHALAQGADGLRYVQQVKHPDGRIENIFKVKFGNTESTGELGRVRVLGNSGNYVSKVIEALQSSAVDNEKEQILYKLNINSATFPVINALAMLGFDETVISYFINQPIVVEYAKKSLEKNSSLNKFEQQLDSDLFKQIAKSIVDFYDAKGIKIEVDKKFKDASVSELKEQMSFTAEQIKSMPQEYWGKQLAVLEKLSELNAVGVELGSLMQTINAESKGLGGSLHGSIDREHKVDNLDSTTMAVEDGKSTSGVYGAEQLVNNTVNGFVIDYAIRDLNVLGGALYPYKNPAFIGAMKYLKAILNKKDLSINQQEKFAGEFFTAVKSYLFSSEYLFGNKFDLNQKRKELFLGESEIVGKEGDIFNPRRKVLKTPALADIVAAIKATPIGQSNTLLRMLSTDVRQTSSEFKLIKYAASTGKNLDEGELHQAFIALFRESVDIEYTIGGKKRTINSTKLAEDLIYYTYLSGGIQEAIQFTRYIPIEVLDFMGFTNKLKAFGKNLNDNALGNKLSEDGHIVDSIMVEQFLQHNPDLVPMKIGNTHKSSSKAPERIIDVKYGKAKNGVEVIVSFKPEVINGTSPFDGVKYVSGSYLASSDEFSGSKYEDMIYKWNGTEFESISVLGSFGVDEYSFMKPATSSIDSRNLKERANGDMTKDKSGEPINGTEDGIFKKYNQRELAKTKDPITEILSRISEKSDNEYHRDLAKRLMDNVFLRGTVSQATLEFADKKSGFTSKGRWHYGKKSLTMQSDKNEFRDENHLEETFLHEIIHAYTSEIIGILDNSNIEDLIAEVPAEVLDAYNRINTMRRGLLNLAKQSIPGFRDSHKRVQIFLDAKDKSKIGESDMIKAGDELAYGLSKNEEFLTMALTNENFRSSIDSLSATNNRPNIIERLFDAILRLLGLNSMSQINKEYVSTQIMSLIDSMENMSRDMSNEEYNPIISENKRSKIFSNKDFVEATKILEEMDGDVFVEEVQQPPVISGQKSPTTDIFQQAAQENPGETKDYSPKFNEADLMPTPSETVTLKKKYGDNALEQYMNLTVEEKESILNCLK